MTLPPIPKDRDYSEATWRAGLDEAVRRDTSTICNTWSAYTGNYLGAALNATIAHATTLLDAGIVKPVVSEAETVWLKANKAWEDGLSSHLGKEAAIAVIQSALDKARAGQ